MAKEGSVPPHPHDVPPKHGDGLEHAGHKEGKMGEDKPPADTKSNPPYGTSSTHRAPGTEK